MKYCRYCGGEVSDTAKACGHCGKWLAHEEATPPAVEPREGGQAEREAVAPPTSRPVSPEREKPQTVPPAPAPEITRDAGGPTEAGGPATYAAPPVATARPSAGTRLPTASEVTTERPAPPRAAAARPESETVVPPMAPPSSGRKKRVPAWVWGVGAVIVMLMAGAALVASGVLSLPGQQAAPPPPTAAQQPASVPPASVEPVTILLGREEVWQTVNADQEIYVEWVWGVCDSSLLHDNLDALDFKLTIDGQMAAQGKMAEYRTQLLQEDKDGVRIFWQHYAYSLGGFRSGSVHWVDLDRGFFRDVTDGCDLDGDGGLDWYGRDSTLTTTAHLIVR